MSYITGELTHEEYLNEVGFGPSDYNKDLEQLLDEEDMATDGISDDSRLRF